MKTNRMMFGIVYSMVVVYFSWRLLEKLVEACALGSNLDMVISIALIATIIVLFMRSASRFFYKGSFLALDGLNKWDVVTVRAIYFDGNTAYCIVESPSREKFSIKFSVTDKSTEKFRPDYHYKFNGKYLVPLPIGKKN